MHVVTRIFNGNILWEKSLTVLWRTKWQWGLRQKCAIPLCVYVYVRVYKYVCMYVRVCTKKGIHGNTFKTVNPLFSFISLTTYIIHFKYCTVYIISLSYNSWSAYARKKDIILEKKVKKNKKILKFFFKWKKFRKWTKNKMKNEKSVGKIR